MDKRVSVQINYFGPLLSAEDLDRVLDPNFNALVGTVYEGHKDLLELFFDLPISALSKEILERYIEATPREIHLPLAPHSSEIFENLLKPLKQAKKNYCLGDYLSVIAVGGVISEMLAILAWKMNGLLVGGRLLSEEGEEQLFGSTLERLGQTRRINILKTLGFITREQAEKFDQIRGERRRYLHFWSSGDRREQAQALTLLKRCFELFKDITGIGFGDSGTVKVNPKLLKMIEEANHGNSSA